MDAYRSRTKNEAAAKVYINPNFKGSQRPLQPSQTNSLMHINPNFSQQLSHRKSNNQSSKRIYINPNFVRTNPIINVPATQSTITDVLATSSTSNIYTERQQTQGSQGNTLSKPPPLTATVTKSRYKFVRRNTDNEKKIVKTESLTTTYKCSKYKTMPMQDVKKSINSIQYHNVVPVPRPKTSASVFIRGKSSGFSHTLSNHYRLMKSKSHTVSSRYKIVKSVKLASTSTPTKSPVVSRRLSLLKSTPRTIKARIKENKKIFKKNNIPCPLYRKYGKCLRNVQGDCEFLHDKKHVSICRKFLKGICHDKECLMSHEMSKEKMPTCSFYLKGVCTKEDCPYLHVKLNDNTEICRDFLKGYCNRGDECLKRHINVCPDLAKMGVCQKKKCPYPHRMNRNNRTKTSRQNTKTYKLQAKDKGHSFQKNDVKDDKTCTDSRYYANDGASTSAVEVIKPSRCKLGTLPSFIQL